MDRAYKVHDAYCMMHDDSSAKIHGPSLAHANVCVFIPVLLHNCLIVDQLVENRRGARGGIDWGGDTLKDYTKPRRTIQSPKKTLQRHNILDKTLTY